jgi:hypothetical protein
MISINAHIRFNLIVELIFIFQKKKRKFRGNIFGLTHWKSFLPGNGGAREVGSSDVYDQ